MSEAVSTDVSAREQAKILLEAHGREHEATCHEITHKRMIQALRRDDCDAYLYWREVDEVMGRKDMDTATKAC